MKTLRCHRQGCQNSGILLGVRDATKTILLFCPECFNSLVNSGIIDYRTSKILAN